MNITGNVQLQIVHNIRLAVPVPLAPPASERFGLDGLHLRREVGGPDVGWGLRGWEGEDKDFRQSGWAEDGQDANPAEPLLKARKGNGL